MADTATQALQVQIGALIDGWQRDRVERDEQAPRATDESVAYDQGYRDALDRCIQALKMLST